MPTLLHVVQSTIGGTLEYLKLLLPRLERRGFANHVLCADDGPMRRELAELGIPVSTVEMQREISVARDLASLVSVARHVGRTRPALVHLHSSKAGVLGRLAAAAHGIPSVYTAHGWSFNMNVAAWKRCLYAAIERACSPLCARIVNISSAEAASARRFAVAPADKMATITNGIDVERFAAPVDRARVRRALGVGDGAYLVGMVARLCVEKDVLTFVEAARRVAARLAEARFVLVGDGDLRPLVETRIREAGLAARFHLTGWTTRVPELVAAFDAALLTSACEGFGLAVAEYMAARRPVVASRLPAIAEIVRHGTDGILVAPGDAAGFADAVLALRADPALSARLVEQAHARVAARFHIDRVVDEHVALYRQILA